ncbi:IclR family transcriptional regulator [Nocardia puris]|uniref:Glycerol operon regulatory protein n=1 Tax=Nocardia puris TaxID=208602 RepID=A0A366DU75_9NOCA|nr:IclR family transcriptional regulator [Nocardia puris]MBF6210226.1 IclR family transcriptional regulator [Nocardia puris]MBF6367302.1 IclR family transcriptional regulator [Nocardia puris]MBF6457487.1 IclR family transcriptional regulator [Nocardia puris]RBO93642.1 IclR family transcriptional regulator [Nocardia puris]
MPGPIQSIERAAAILRVVADAPFGVGVGELASALGLPKTTAHGLLRTLLRVGYLDQDPRTGRYLVGTAALGLTAPPLDTNVLRSYAMNWADTLAARTGESVRIGALHGERVRIAHHVFRPGGGPQTLRVGVDLPLHATALGKVLLAYTPGLTERAGTGALAAFTRRTITAPRTLASEIARVRAQGYAEDVGEYSFERASLAAPLRDAGGRVVGAIGIVGDLDRLTDPSHRAAHLDTVRAVAQSISRDLAAEHPRR